MFGNGVPAHHLVKRKRKWLPKLGKREFKECKERNNLLNRHFYGT